MKKVITYGTFDLFHEGHLNLLKQAKLLGDYLIVGITSDYFDKCRGKYNVHDSLMTRISNVQETGLADEIVIEEYFGQKIDDIKKYGIDIFTVGSDWVGYFDYLREYCEVIYSKRTKGISSTQIRNTHSLKLGIIGGEKIVDRFLSEVSFISGVSITGVYSAGPVSSEKCKELHEYNSLNEFFSQNDAVYVNVPLKYRYKHIKESLLNGKHVLTEFPFSNSYDNAKELIELANARNLVLMEGLKTAYCPAFTKMISLVKSGVIGNILNIEARFTQVLEDDLFNEQTRISGGSIESLVSYPLLIVFKLLGINYEDISFTSHFENNIDIFTKIDLRYSNSIASATVAIKAKAESNLIIAGTKGYIYVPAPWWKTEFFEVCYENINNNNKYFYKFEGEGLRYELVEFIRTIQTNSVQNNLLNYNEMLAETKVIDLFLSNYNVKKF